MKIPSDSIYWAETIADGSSFRLGLTEAFVESLPGGLVGIELQPAGTRLAAGETFGFIHAAEKTLDLRVPSAITIAAINAAAVADPRLITTSPHLRGWLIEVAY